MAARLDLLVDDGRVDCPFSPTWDRACAVAMLQDIGWSDDHIHWWIGRQRGLPVPLDTPPRSGIIHIRPAQ